MLHPRIVRRVGVRRRAPVLAGSGAQLVVPGLVAVDLAQPVLGAVLEQPCRGSGRPDVYRVPRHVSRRIGGGDPARGFLFRAVLRDRLTQESFLVGRGAPAAVDLEPDTVVFGIGRSAAQGRQQVGVEVRDGRDLVIEDRRAVGNGATGDRFSTTPVAYESPCPEPSTSLLGPTGGSGDFTIEGGA